MPRFLILFFVGISVSLAAQAEPQDAESIILAVEAHLAQRAEVYPGTATISVNPPRLRNQQHCNDLQASSTTGQRLRSRQTVTVRCTSPRAWSLHVQANVNIEGYYYVSNRTINVGEIISLDDLSPREGDLLRLAPSVVTDPSHIIGYMAGQRMNTGSVIKASALRDPQSIQRGQAVRTIARGMGFVATGEGQALQDGAPGSQIQVRSSSGQVITGTVLDAHTVQIVM